MNKIVILIAAVTFVVFAIYLASQHADHGASSGEHATHIMEINSERAFLEHMIPHHEEAVVVANLVLQKGSTLRPLTELAEDIVAAQTIEINQMKDWYQAWYGAPYLGTDTYVPMMRPLEELSGVEFERVFLEDMILHHEAAVVAANSVLRLALSPETKELAQNIIIAQETEIVMMRELLNLLPR